MDYIIKQGQKGLFKVAKGTTVGSRQKVSARIHLRLHGKLKKIIKMKVEDDLNKQWRGWRHLDTDGGGEQGGESMQ